MGDDVSFLNIYEREVIELLKKILARLESIDEGINSNG